MESRLKDRILKYSKSEPDVWLKKYHGSTFTLRGHPDVYGNVGPFAVYLELKEPGKPLAKLQGAVGRQITRSGALFARVDDFDDFLRIIEGLRKRAVDLSFASR